MNVLILLYDMCFFYIFIFLGSKNALIFKVVFSSKLDLINNIYFFCFVFFFEGGDVKSQNKKIRIFYAKSPVFDKIDFFILLKFKTK